MIQEVVQHPGVFLKNLLKEKTMSRKELSALTDFSENKISKITTGKMNLTYEDCLVLGIILDTETTYWSKAMTDYNFYVYKVLGKK